MRNCSPIFCHTLFCRYQACLATIVLLFFIMVSMEQPISADDILTWSELPSLPDAEGFAGPFAGTHNGTLVVAGGANFPDKMPWEGGTKVWYDRIFVLEKPDGSWREAGALPRPLGYGVSLSTSNGILCIGGSDAKQHYADCFRLQWSQGKLSTVALPSLPQACANFCGALIDNTVYVAGGLESPTATKTLKTFWSLDLSDSSARWQELEPWPGAARMLAVAAVQDKTFFLCSGTDLHADSDGKPVREYLKNAYNYRPGHGWKQIADMPRAAVAAPTPAPAMGQSTFLVLSGDDGMLVDFQPPERHPGFPKSILAYHTLTDAWRTIGVIPVGHVTTSIVRWNNRFVMPSGEIRPGKRSPIVRSIDANTNETELDMHHSNRKSN